MSHSSECCHQYNTRSEASTRQYCNVAIVNANPTQSQRCDQYNIRSQRYHQIKKIFLVLVNSGFTQRANLFRKNFDPKAEFRPEGTTFFGRLHHDLISTETPLPPGSKISLEFDHSDDEFVILCPASDAEKYKINLIEFNLYIPVAELTQNVYQEFNALLTKPRESKAGAINIHYRRSEVRPISIPKNAQEFYSGN